MIPTSVRRYSEQKSNPYVENNPYSAKKLWPPDFTRLSTKQQFRLERRYKRRSKLKFQSPGWIKSVKLAQLGTMTSVLFYGVLFIDWKQPHQPFQGLRKWFNDVTGTEWAPTNEIMYKRRLQLEEQQRRLEDVSPVRKDLEE